MRTQTRKGLTVVINPSSFVKQEQIDLGHETYYLAYRADGSTVELQMPISGVSVEKIDRRPRETQVEALPTQMSESKLLKAEDCPSAGESTWGAIKRTDPHSEEKYKGETYYTHKSAPGLVIKKDNRVIHETKMSDMYRRRD